MIMNINKYPIYKRNIIFLEELNTATRKKFRVYNLKNNKFGIFKYPSQRKHFFKEIFSEKLSSELAKFLGFECASIDLALDQNNEIGIISYLFIDENQLETHADFSNMFIDNSKGAQKDFYNLDDIKMRLDGTDEKLFFQLFEIIIFDSLVGECDRHWGNWGIKRTLNSINISPLYDTAACLLRDYGFNSKCPVQIDQLFDYANKSKTQIRKLNGEKFGHFEIVIYLMSEYPKEIKELLKKVTNISDKNIEKIVNKIPGKYMQKKNKIMIIEYIKCRRDILISLMKG